MALLEKIVPHTEFWIMYEYKLKPDARGVASKLFEDHAARRHLEVLRERNGRTRSYELYEVRVERTVVGRVG